MPGKIGPQVEHALQTERIIKSNGGVIPCSQTVV